MSSHDLQERALRLFGQAVIHLNEPMSSHTSFRIGGPAWLFAAPMDVPTLRRLLDFCRAEGLPWFILGFGTNLLVADAGYQGMIIHLRKGWESLRVSGTSVEVAAGHSLPKLARKAADAGLSGLEFAAGIPGSVGGAVAMNAGAFGGCMADVVRRVDCLTPGGEEVSLDFDEMRFAYRRSRILDEPLIVTRVCLALKPDDRQTILQRMEEFQTERKARQPWSAWSAGSVFRNPPGDAAGRLIEAAGCKGLRIGGALVSTKHANFIVNAGGATAADVLALLREVQRRVEEESGIRLEPEITLLGEF